ARAHARRDGSAGAVDVAREDRRRHGARRSLGRAVFAVALARRRLLEAGQGTASPARDPEQRASRGRQKARPLAGVVGGVSIGAGYGRQLAMGARARCVRDVRQRGGSGCRMSDREEIVVVETAAPPPTPAPLRKHPRVAAAYAHARPFVRAGLFGAAFAAGALLFSRLFGPRVADRLGRQGGEGFAKGVAEGQRVASSLSRGARFG